MTPQPARLAPPTQGAAVRGQLAVQPGDQAAVEQVQEWFRAYHASGDPAIRERIIVTHLQLADRLASRFRRTRGIPHDDLVQAARLGLVTAVNHYDPSRASPFIAYAMVCITGELKRYLRDSSWCLHIARSTKERALQVRGAKDSLGATLGRDPTVAELADHLGLSENCVLDALEAIGARHAYSLDRPVDPEGMVSVGALVPAPTSHVDVDDRLALPELLDSLPKVERQAVMLRFYSDRPQREISDLLGCSQMHVSRLLRRALTRMRAQLLS